MSEDELNLQAVQRTMGSIIKQKDDFKKVNEEKLATILTEIGKKKRGEGVPSRGR